jgi:hypothetical protein
MRGVSLKILLKYLDLKVVNREVQYMEEGQQIVALFVMCSLPVLWHYMRMWSMTV